MSRLLIGAIAAALAGLGAVPWLPATPDPTDAVRQSASEDKRPHVEIAHPQRKTLHRRLKVSGEVRPNQDVGIYARVPGYLAEIPVDRGTWVKQGDVLARIAVPDLEKAIAKDRCELEMCAPSLQKAAAERDWRKTVWERLDGVAKKTPNLINQELLDDAAGRCRMAESEVDLVKARTKALEAAVAKTQALMDFATLRAPFDGVVTERWVDPGGLVQPGSTKLLHLVQGGVVRIRVHVPQSEVPGVREDTRADIGIDELPGRNFQAKLARIFWGLSRETKTMAVEIDLKNDHADRGLWVRPGMFARVTLNLDPRTDVLVLPASALVVDKKKTFVFVARDGVARKVPVEVGLDNGIEFEVKSGLTDSEDVVVNGKNLISDNDKIRTTRRDSR